MSIIVGITGGTGAGKTTLARHLAERYSQIGVALVDQDSYYRDQSHLTLAERASVNYDEPAAIDYDLLLEQLQELLAGRSIRKPAYSFTTHTRIGAGELVASQPIIVVEGLFALWEPRVRSLMALKIYVDADPDIRFNRRLQRDINTRGRSVQSVVEQYLQTVRPMHELHVEPKRKYADLVVKNNGCPEGSNWRPALARVASLLA